MNLDKIIEMNRMIRELTPNFLVPYINTMKEELESHCGAILDEEILSVMTQIGYHFMSELIIFINALNPKLQKVQVLNVMYSQLRFNFEDSAPPGTTEH